MAKLTIIAHITARPGQTELVKASLEKLIAPTLAEEGCINYDLHQDNANPAHFMFYENWDSRELWQAHTKSQHLAAHKQATEGAIAETVIHEMTHIV